MQAETRLQISVIRWWNLACRSEKLDERLLMHFANGGKRGKVEASILKAMGVRAGAADLLLAVPRGASHGLFCELKTQTGRISPDQKEMLPLLEAQGYAVIVCWSFDECVRAITNYLKTGNPLLRQ